MIHPSYFELMDRINRGVDINEEPVITSRYSIVLATSKRARQLTNGAEPKVKVHSNKLLSVAIDELYQGAVNIIPEEAEEETETPSEETA